MSGDWETTFTVTRAGVELGRPVVHARRQPDQVIEGLGIRDIQTAFLPPDGAGVVIAVSGSNRMVPLEQIAKVSMGKGPSQIQHSDGKRQISVAANAQGRSPGEVTADALALASL